MDVMPLVAVNVTVSPEAPPVILMEGEVSAVRSSEFDAPVSDAGRKFGAAGIAGALVSMTIDSGALDNETLPAGSVRVAVTDHVPLASVERSQLVAVPIT